MATFGLVHGAWHGAWCWELLAAELEKLGHAAVAMDLPCEDWDAGLEDNAAVVTGALAGAGPDVILVGHSLGGITIPVVAARRPAARLVFLCGMVPEPGRSLADTMHADAPRSTEEWANARRITEADGAASWEPEAAIRTLYHDCPPAVAQWAASRLRRQVWTTARQPCPLERWPDVASSYILCLEDKAFIPEWSRRLARERLGVEAIELPGGHSPMLSRPAQLAEVLAGLAGAG